MRRATAPRVKRTPIGTHMAASEATPVLAGAPKLALFISDKTVLLSRGSIVRSSNSQATVS